MLKKIRIKGQKNKSCSFCSQHIFKDIPWLKLIKWSENVLQYVIFKVLRSLALSSKAATFGYPKARGATKQFNFNGKRRERWF